MGDASTVTETGSDNLVDTAARLERLLPGLFSLSAVIPGRLRLAVSGGEVVMDLTDLPYRQTRLLLGEIDRQCWQRGWRLKVTRCSATVVGPSQFYECEGPSQPLATLLAFEAALKGEP